MSRRFALLAVFVFVLGAISGPAVSATIYNIDVSAGSMSAKGTITTDSTLGTLSTANILDWHIYLATSTESFTLNGASNSVAAIAGTGVSAQASGLYFDFSRVDGGFLVLEAMPLGGGLNYLCFDDIIAACGGYPSSASVYLTASGAPFAFAAGVQQIAVATTPIPPALPLFASALGGLSFFGWRRKRSASAA